MWQELTSLHWLQCPSFSCFMTGDQCRKHNLSSRVHVLFTVMIVGAFCLQPVFNVQCVSMDLRIPVRIMFRVLWLNEHRQICLFISLFTWWTPVYWFLTIASCCCRRKLVFYNTNSTNFDTLHRHGGFLAPSDVNILFHLWLIQVIYSRVRSQQQKTKRSEFECFNHRIAFDSHCTKTNLGFLIT